MQGGTLRRPSAIGYRLSTRQFASTGRCSSWSKVLMKSLFLANVCGLGLAFFGAASTVRADVFGSGANSFQIDFVTIGSPGNPPDANPNPAGAVPYEYRIGKYEISEQM